MQYLLHGSILRKRKLQSTNKECFESWCGWWWLPLTCYLKLFVATYLALVTCILVALFFPQTFTNRCAILIECSNNTWNNTPSIFQAFKCHNGQLAWVWVSLHNMDSCQCVYCCSHMSGVSFTFFTWSKWTDNQHNFVCFFSSHC